MTKNFLSMLAVPLLMAAACSSPEATETATAPHEKHSHHSHDHGEKATAKPGAAIAFEASLRAPVDADDDGVLEVVIRNAYEEGALAVTAASTTLTIAERSVSYTTSLAGADTHRWDIFFSVPADGAHYVNLFATVSGPGGVTGTRSQSIPVRVGAIAATQKSNGDMTMDASGDPVMVMEAEEATDEKSTSPN